MKKSVREILILFLACALFGIVPGIAQEPRQLELETAAQGTVQPIGDREASRPAGTGDRRSVLIYFEPSANRFSSQRAAVKAAAVQRGGFTRYEYGSTMPNVINVRNVSAEAIDALRAMPGVVKIEEDMYHPNLVRLDEATPLVRGLDTQVAAGGHSADGTGIRVCVADTGIDMDHIMFADRIDTAASYDFYNNDSNPDDDQGHGTHVAGIAVGGTGLSVDFGCDGPEPFQGVAPAATLIGAKILNQFGGGNDSDIIAGIDHCADQSASGGRADVINLSIGIGNYTSGACTHSWAVASNNAVANGVVVVAASGNENNSNSMGSPACGADVIAVGATYKDSYPNCEDDTTNFNWGDCVDSSPSADQIVCFSNQSDFLDVAAPGSVIWSASNSAGGSTITGQSGTSMASPMVAGLAALLLDADGSLTPAQVRQLLRDGAVELGAPGCARAYGHGRIDVVATLDLVTPCGNDADCDDGVFCNGAETCNAGSCQAGGDPCPGQDCNESTDSCQPLVCDMDLVCDAGEDCNNCSSDCPSGAGASCGNGICEPGEDCTNCADCRGQQDGRPSNRYCCGGDPGGGGGTNPVDCGDARCSSNGWQGGEGGHGFCCGDGSCDSGEDVNNCAIDCLVLCSGPADCDDAVACTDDVCQGDGSCTNTANDANCPDDGQFCNGTEFCDGSADCSSTGNPCSGGEVCNETTDTCDTVSCGGNNTPCSSDSECCSGNCRGNGLCK
jgi:subtilisin family serine protease